MKVAQSYMKQPEIIFSHFGRGGVKALCVCGGGGSLWDEDNGKVTRMRRSAFSRSTSTRLTLQCLFVGC